jgi:hypothetical protein
MSEDRLDMLLKRHLRPRPGDGDGAARVMAALARPLPRQKTASWTRWPGILLDWQFAPAWPRMAALAGCAVLGFAIGLSSVGRHFDSLRAQSLAESNDLPAVFSEPEPFSGWRP